MKRLKVGINGFGRIGRAFTRIALDRDSMEIGLINTKDSLPQMLAYLLKYDSIYRTFQKEVTHDDNSISVDGKKITVTQVTDPATIPWQDYGVDVVVDATGAFTTSEQLRKHVRGTVKKVVLTAPSKDEATPHILLGVNDNEFDFKNSDIISNCSCTTNCAAPLFKVLHDSFTVTSGFLSTIHAYTSTQALLDNLARDEERSRAAGLNIVPSSTGAAKAVVKAIPSLKGKIDGMSMRVPVPVVSFTDVSAYVEKEATIEEVNNAFKTAADGFLKGILKYEKEILVSSDYIGSPYSCIFDSNYTKVIQGNLVKVFGWYDNEWGYSSRLVDLVEKLANFV